MRLSLAGMLTATTLLTVLGAAAPACADQPAAPLAEAAATTGLAYQVPATIDVPRLQAPQNDRARTISRGVLYVLQAVDAMQSARAFQLGRYERNPLMRPFSHGGVAGMAAGFALGDVARDLALRHAPQRVKLAGDAAQAASNLEGILATRAALKAGTLPGY